MNKICYCININLLDSPFVKTHTDYFNTILLSFKFFNYSKLVFINNNIITAVTINNIPITLQMVYMYEESVN
jgi:hypothetical protein